MDAASFFNGLKQGIDSDFDYTYGIIDFQYILTRNKNLLSSNLWSYYKNYVSNIPLDVKLPNPEPLNKSQLLKVTLQSIMKLKREFNFRYPILCLDVSPYHKVTAIAEYKADRYVPTDEEIDELEKQKEGKTPAEVREICIQQNKVLYEQMNHKVLSEIKYGFVSEEWNGTGFITCLKKGYEADDLAYMLAKKVNSIGISDGKTNAILLTSDKDWANFQMPRVEFISTYTGHGYPKITEEYLNDAKLVNECSNKLYSHNTYMNRYEWGILCEISGYTHNNAKIWDHPRHNWHEFATKVLNKDESLVDYKIARTAFEAMNMDIGYTSPMKDWEGNLISDKVITYKEDCEDLLNFKLTDHSFKPGVFVDLISSMNNVDINFSSYNAYVKGLDVIR